MNAIFKASDAALSRRSLLRAMGGIGIGLVIGADLAPLGSAALAATPEPAAFNPFVRIGPDGTVTVIIKHLDLGQGTATGLATLVAEEMDADWAKIRTEFAPLNPQLYGNKIFGGAQGTGGSTAMAASFDVYRRAGATARAMLLEAGAKALNVPADAITITSGTLIAGPKSVTFGELAEAAAKEKVPQDPPLKQAANYALVGKDGTHRVDNVAKTSGTATYTQDVKLPGMLVAVVAHPPRFGAKAGKVDDAAARAVKGVEAVVVVPQGVAVLARTTHAAMKGRDALKVEWNEAGAEKRGTDALRAEYRALLGQKGNVAESEGNVDAAFAHPGVKVVEADFEFPYLAHAPMEPMNAVAQITGDRVTVWTASQFPSADAPGAAAAAGTSPDKVTINSLWAGGSFGRRAVATADFVVEAVSIAKAHGKGVPVKLVWTREDDMKAGYYRPMYLHRVKAAVDAAGKPVAWQHHVVGQSILSGTFFEKMMVVNNIDATSVEGATEMGYEVPNRHVELTSPKTGVPVLWWRSVGHTHTAYAVETMIDQLAKAAGKDPVAFRMDIIKDPRLKAVLALVAEKARWGTSLEPGRFRGVAAHKSFNTYVAEVAEITLLDKGYRVDRVVAAVDCGFVVNPDVVRAQVEGGVGFGLGHAMQDAITLTDGVVDQANFDTYEPLRMSQMPKVEVHIMPSTQPPTGIGEPGVPPIAPAVANALFAATGKPILNLPFNRQTIGS
ncbi:xanthine dehydrogenase family protein molybdopterin-binding subunit [Azorhizobium doebereinerae]|uniref:xanthine dehydrogenase family protein molybdopterin-binding subunit n=1 Tax=Azorhizobium doebereinerae TaxID=281091 RepID=UPI00040BC866|nr:xanthine dehydrogenase family protein molybdopterin-binding subunit [Azorhizobium doebereinerae]